MTPLKSKLYSEPQIGMRTWITRHPVSSFFVLAYAITRLAWLPDILGYGASLARY